MTHPRCANQPIQRLCFFFVWRCGPTRAMASSFVWFRGHTKRRITVSCGRVISSSQRPLPDNTQHPQQTNIHAPCGIRTHDLSRRAAVDPRLRTRGHWDWHSACFTYLIILVINQLNAQFLFYNRFIKCLYMFRAL